MTSVAPLQPAQSHQPQPLPPEYGPSEQEQWLENPRLATITYTTKPGTSFQNEKRETTSQIVMDLRLHRNASFRVADTFEAAMQVANDEASLTGTAAAVLQASDGAFHVRLLQGLGRDPKFAPHASGGRQEAEYPKIDRKHLSPDVASVELVSHEPRLKAVIGKYEWIDLRGDNADFEPVAVPATA